LDRAGVCRPISCVLGTGAVGASPPRMMVSARLCRGKLHRTLHAMHLLRGSSASPGRAGG
jgi:hypothetical protein